LLSRPAAAGRPLESWRRRCHAMPCEIARNLFMPKRKGREGRKGARSQSPARGSACVRVRRHSGKDGSRLQAEHHTHHARAADTRRTHVVSLFPLKASTTDCQRDVLADDLMDGAMFSRSRSGTACGFVLWLGRCHVPKRPGACFV
jgi:hypothetical protein